VDTVRAGAALVGARVAPRRPYFAPGVAVLVVGADVVGAELVGVLVVGVLDVVPAGVLVVGLVAVGVLAVGVDAVEGFGTVAVPVAGKVFGGLVMVLTSDVSPETATNAAATPPSASRKIAARIMIGTRQLPGRRTCVVAA
jgi:purine-cytosine permease-like protein